MLRTAVFSIVLALVVGQSTALMCGVSCDPREAAATECQHHDAITSTRLVAEGNCSVVFSTAAFIREDVRRSGSGLLAHEFVAIPSDQFHPARTGARLTRDSFGASSFERRARETTPLRI